MKMSSFLDFFMINKEPRYRVLFELIGESRLRPIVRRICRGAKFSDRVSEYCALDLIIKAFPFLENENSLSFRELKQILSFFSLIEDLGEFYDKYHRAPQSRYSGHTNLGKRYSNFIVRHSEKEARVEVLCRYIGSITLPHRITWEQSQRNKVLDTIYEGKWAIKLAALIQFKAKTGGCYVPGYDKDNASLRRWCYRQLNLFNRGILREDRVIKLRELGFFDCYGAQNTIRLAS